MLGLDQSEAWKTERSAQECGLAGPPVRWGRGMHCLHHGELSTLGRGDMSLNIPAVSLLSEYWIFSAFPTC